MKTEEGKIYNFGGGRKSTEFSLGEDPENMIHVDINTSEDIDIHADVFDKLPFEDNSISHIRSSHCLEHTSYRNTVPILKEWNRVLKKNGRIDIWQSNFNFKALTWVLRSLLKKETNPGFVMGSHIGYDEHKTFFTPTLLKQNLTDAGFKNIKIKKGRNIAEYKQGIGKYIQKIVWLEIHAIAFKDDDF
ncbi:MAG: hypothetical protein CMO19_01945 [Thaumarchaeota archaeon]|nr:hypothetical protein [Nitrososphaerota archaeon]|tara:strand:- start:666 stop:1232 length:567 start_codon:yes stop_codon:yes gene_type:complete